MGIVASAKALLPRRLTNALSRAAYPYRHGARFFRPYVVRDKAMEGQTFDFYVGNRTGRAWYDRECINNPVWREMRFIRDQMVEPGDIIFECGGHHGCSAILLSRWVGDDGKVVTFEPLLENFRILERNVELNGLRNVIARREAVGATHGTILFDEATSGIASDGIPVKVVKLDDYADLQPTFLKIDVEGFEQQVLEGAQKILAQRPKIQLEVHAELLGKYGTSVDQILRTIGIDKYDVWVQWKDDEMPVRYEPGTPITHRVHLFCIPRDR